MWWAGILALSLATLTVVPAATAEGAPQIIVDSKLELFVSDPVRSAAFYAVLGIAVVHENTSGYKTLRSGSTVIALSPVPWWLPVHWLGILRYPPMGTEIVFYTTQLERSRAAFERAGYSPGEIVVQAWADRDFRLTDPDGYYVRVSEGVGVPAAHQGGEAVLKWRASIGRLAIAPSTLGSSTVYRAPPRFASEIGVANLRADRKCSRLERICTPVGGAMLQPCRCGHAVFPLDPVRIS